MKGQVINTSRNVATLFCFLTRDPKHNAVSQQCELWWRIWEVQSQCWQHWLARSRYIKSFQTCLGYQRDGKNILYFQSFSDGQSSERKRTLFLPVFLFLLYPFGSTSRKELKWNFTPRMFCLYRSLWHNQGLVLGGRWWHNTETGHFKRPRKSMNESLPLEMWVDISLFICI